MKPPFEWRESLDGTQRPLTNDDARFARDNRRGDRGDIVRVVLIIRIEIDDGVRTQRKRVTNTRHEGLPQPPMRHFKDVCGAEVTRHRGGVVGGTVVNDQGFNAIVAGNGFR